MLYLTPFGVVLWVPMREGYTKQTGHQTDYLAYPPGLRGCYVALPRRYSASHVPRPALTRDRSLGCRPLLGHRDRILC